MGLVSLEGVLAPFVGACLGRGDGSYLDPTDESPGACEACEVATCESGRRRMS